MKWWAVLVARMLFASRLQAVVLFRLAQLIDSCCDGAGAPLKWANQVLTGADIAVGADIDGGLRLYHPTGVVEGPKVRAGERCTLMQHITLGHDHGGSPTLGHDVFVGPGSCILGPIIIGDRARIGANSVVFIDVPDDAVAVGNPARARETKPSNSGGDPAF